MIVFKVMFINISKYIKIILLYFVCFCFNNAKIQTSRF
jgi:hypothetical protein